ncbi:17779_t:CDS:1, partial [Gigaspora rosea]
MPFSRQQRWQIQQHQRQRRGSYVTRACTNCQKKHTKCSGGAACERCTLRNLRCTFIDSGKKRGPKTDGNQVNVSNSSENYIDGTSMPSSIIPNPAQGHASTLSLSGYPQQQPDNIDDVTLYSEFYDPEQVNILNNFENDFDRTSLLPSIIPNPAHGHASILSLSGYPPQQSDNIEDVTLYSKFYEPEQIYINNFEDDIDGASILYSMIPNFVQNHASTLSLSGCPPQQLDYIEDVTLYSDFYEKKTAHAFQE